MKPFFDGFTYFFSNLVAQPVGYAGLEQIIPQLFPSLRNLHITQRWAGLMAFTPDLLPIADRVQHMPNVWFGSGFNGHGMPFGIRLGQLLAEAVTRNSTPAALKPFRLDRPTLVEET